MTRRLALLLIGAFAQTSRIESLRWTAPTAPVHLHIDLNNWDGWTVTHRGKSVTFTSEQIFAALHD